MNEPYRTAAQTDIVAAWKEKYGYVHASEQPATRAKHQMYLMYGRDTGSTPTPPQGADHANR